jgi:hypothetical protein
MPAVEAATKAKKTSTQTAGKAAKPKDDRHKYGYGVSVTTGWRKIEGWQSDVIRKNQNLEHWNWCAMQEMNKGYQRLRPGDVGTRRQSIYKRPTKVATVIRPTRVAQAAPVSRESRYVRPVHVALPTRSSVATDLRYKAPATHVTLAAPQTGIRYAVPSTNARLAVPSTSAKLAVPSTSARLAVPSTNIKLAAKPRPAQPKPVGDAMSDVGDGATDDTFQSPELQDSPYGPRTGRSYVGSKTSQNVRGKIVKKH